MTLIHRGRNGLLGMLILACVLAVVAPAAQAQGPHRGYDRGYRTQYHHGFTLQLAVGAGTVSYLRDRGEGDNQTYGALAGVLQLGGFLTPRLALTAKLSAMDWGRLHTDDVDLGMVGFLGPNIQFWLGNHFSFEGGVGIGYTTIQGNGVRIGGTRFGPDENTVGGLAFALAANYFFWTNHHHALGIQAQFQPTFLEEGPVVNGHFAFVWQYY